MATSTIGGVSVDFVANFARFREDMTAMGKSVKDATGQMAESFKAVNSSIEELTGGLKTLGLAFGIEQIVAFVEHSVEAVGELKALAAQTGLTTDSLQTWQFAARQAGTSAESMTSGIEHLTRIIGQAAEGNDAAIKTFDKLGIGVLDAGGNIRSTDEIVQQVAKAVADAKTPADQARIAYEAFGKVGQQLIPTLLQMADGYDKVHEKADSLWQISTPDAINAADGLIQDIQILTNGLITMAAAIASYVKPIFDGIIETINFISDAIKTFKDTVGSLGYAIGTAGRSVLGLSPITGDRQYISPPMPPPPGGDHNPLSDAGTKGAVDAAKKSADAIQKVIDALKAEYDNLGKDSEQQKINTALRQANVAATSAAGQQIISVIHQGEAYRDMLAEMNQEDKDHNALMKDGRDLMTSLETPAEKYADQVMRLDQLLAGGALSLDDYNLALARMDEAYAAADPAIKTAIQDQENLRKSIEDAAGALLTDLGRAFTDSGNAADRWKNFVTHAIQDVMGVVDQLLKKVLGTALDALFAGLGGGVAGGIPGGGAEAEIGSNFTGAFKLAAGGGTFGAGDWGIVGEEGPELVRFGQAAQVYPNGTGGAGNVAYIDARGADLGAVARIEKGLRDLHYSIEHRAIAAVSAQRKRGGTFAATFNG